MKIQWQPDLATGHLQIDEHHKEMFEKINQLIEACKEKREKPVIVEMLDFLNRYVSSHFAVEEAYWEQHGIQHTREHLRQHQELRTKLDALNQECLHEGVTLAVVARSLNLTYLWLKGHIQKMDREMVVASQGGRP